jgi:hypothetical protein
MYKCKTSQLMHSRSTLANLNMLDILRNLNMLDSRYTLLNPWHRHPCLSHKRGLWDNKVFTEADCATHHHHHQLQI